jgi:hypothetical protein
VTDTSDLAMAYARALGAAEGGLRIIGLEIAHTADPVRALQNIKAELEKTREHMARFVPDHTRVAGAPWAKDALFVISTWGDAAGSEIVRGWEALCERIVALHYFRPDDAQRAEVMERFTDWDRWDDGPDHQPRFWHVDYEDGHITVERITVPYTIDIELATALRSALAIAREAREEWDKAPSGMRAGKLLIALGEGLKGYRPETDAIHAVLAKATERGL